jgi:predicted transposase YdaD
MFTISDLKQTRVYQDARQEGEQLVILRQLNRRFGNLSDRLTQSIQSLTIPQIEELAEQLLDFTAISDLETWLNVNSDLQ